MLDRAYLITAHRRTAHFVFAWDAAKAELVGSMEQFKGDGEA
jgi:hypothetical protein